MIVRIVGSMVIAGVLVLAAPDVRAQTMGCASIRAASQLTGGSLSAEELASKLKVDVETVRNCLNTKPAAPTGQATPTTAAPATPPTTAAPAAPPPTAPATKY